MIVDLDTIIEEMAPYIGKDYATLGINRSNNVFVFSKDFIEEDWDSFWRAWKFANDFVYEPGSGMCDEFVAEAIAKFLRSVRKKLVKTEATAGAWELRGFLGTKAINGVSGGAHSTVLVAVTTDQKTIQIYVWEPQNEQWTLLQDACANGLAVVGIGL